MKIAIRMVAAVILLAAGGFMAVYLGVTEAFRSVSAAVEIGAAMPEFALKDYNGKEYTLAQCKGKPLVLIFCSQNCPYSRGADPDLAELYAKYNAKGVVFLGIDSHFETTPEDIKKFAAEEKIPYPILKDAGNQYADAAGAKVTPEIFLADKEGKLAYHGALDNRAAPDAKGTEHYLADAIDALLAGKEVQTKQVKSWGCSIKRAK